MPAYTRSADMKQFKEGDRVVIARGKHKGERGTVVLARSGWRQADVRFDDRGYKRRYGYASIVHENTYDRYYR